MNSLHRAVYPSCFQPSKQANCFLMLILQGSTAHAITLSLQGKKSYPLTIS